MFRLSAFWLTALCAGAAACGGGSSPLSSSSALPSSDLVFSVAPIESASIDSITPLGNLNPPGHTLPTSHMYINTHPPGAGPSAPVGVAAPAEGVVQFVRPSGVESQIGIQVGASYTYYLAHVVLDSGIAVGATVHAGQRLGTTGPSGAGVDFGVINSRRTLWFANPARYPIDMINGDAPLTYFVELLKSALYAKVRSLGNPDGKFDFDMAGHLAGNWFLEGTALAVSSSSEAWPGLLAFAFDNTIPRACAFRSAAR